MITTFGDWIRARRRSMQLSQEQLGIAVNYSTIAIRKLEASDRPCSKDLALLLLTALDVPAELSDAFLRSAQSGIVDPALHQLKPTESSDAQDPNAKTASPPPARALIRFAEPATHLFGREVEIAQVLEMLQQPFTRLITLLGPPGVGKSSLATAVLQQAESTDWPDGTFFVPLVVINDAPLIPHAIAAAMGIQEVNARKWRDIVPSQHVFRFIKNKQILLVLDNFEHLPEGVAFLNELLEAAPRVKVIVTSQLSLRVSSEQVYPVRSLPVPDKPAVMASISLTELAENAAVRLFISKAQFRRPSFKLTDENASTIVELCRKLGGLPLALELAAARLKFQSSQELLAQFQALSAQPISQLPQPSALQWLSRSVTNVPHRHQTLFAALTWSYNLLTPEAQTLFEQLGVFQGGFTREAALAMTHGSLESLELLAEHSLLQVQVLPDDRIRLNLLEIFRGFALMKLEARGMTQQTLHQHALYFANQAVQMDAGLRGPEHSKWQAMMELETPNMRSALQWCTDHDPATGTHLATRLVYYWYISGFNHEGHNWVRQMRRAGDGNSAVSPLSRAYLICEAVVLHFEASIPEMEAQLAVFRSLGDTPGIALAQTMLGMMLLKVSPVEAERHLIPAIDTFDALGDTWSSARASTLLAISKYRAAEYAASEHLLNKSIQSQTQQQDFRSLARTYNHLSWLAFVQGHLANASAIGQKAMLMNQQFKDNFGVLQAFNHAAFIAMELNELDQAQTATEKGLRLVRETGTDFFQAPLLLNAGALAQAQHRFKDACQCYLQSITFAQQYAQADHIQMNLIQIAQLAIDVIFEDVKGVNLDGIPGNMDAGFIVTWLYAVQGQSRTSGYHLPLSYQTRLNQTLTTASQKLSPTALEAAIATAHTISWDEATLLARSMAEAIIIGVKPKPRPDVYYVDYATPDPAPFPAR